MPAIQVTGGGVPQDSDAVSRADTDSEDFVWERPQHHGRCGRNITAVAAIAVQPHAAEQATGDPKERRSKIVNGPGGPVPRFIPLHSESAAAVHVGKVCSFILRVAARGFIPRQEAASSDAARRARSPPGDHSSCHWVWHCSESVCFCRHGFQVASTRNADSELRLRTQTRSAAVLRADRLGSDCG
jgi:hypothetical protein